jgi:DNA adenine methylase
MRLSFNGIYRENLRGEFNVPYGYKTWLSACDADQLRLASNALKGVVLSSQTYEKTMALVVAGDLIYVDPPYTVSHNDNGFVKYNRTLFSWEDQRAVAELCEKARRIGAQVIVSNANHSELLRLYPNFEYHQLSRFCPISGAASGRRHITEALLVGKPT